MDLKRFRRTCNETIMSAASTSFLLLFIRIPISEGTQVLRVGYIQTPPDVIVTYNENKTVFDGFAIEILKWLAEDLNFSYEMIPIDYTNGFSGLREEFSNKSLDLGLPLYGLKEGRNKIMTPLLPCDYRTNTLMIPFPKPGSDPWSFGKPYQFTVWIFLLFSMIAVTVLLSLITTWYGKNRTISTDRKTNKRSVEITPFYTIGVLTNQGGYCSSRVRSRSRFVAGLWCLGALVLVNAYSGSLITYMTAPKVTPIVNSIEEMASTDSIQLLTMANSFIKLQIETAPGNLKPLSANLARVPPNLCGESYISNKMIKCIQKVKNGDHAIATEVADACLMINEDFKRTGECSLTLIEHRFFPVYAGLIVPLNTTQERRNALNISILQATSLGLLDKWKQHYYPKGNNPCGSFRNQPKTKKPITLIDMQSAYVILGLGYAISLVVFLYESLQERFAVLITDKCRT